MTLLSLLRFGQRATLTHTESTRIEPRGPAPLQASSAVDLGIAAVTADELLASHEDLLSRIKLCYGADRTTFEQDLLTPIRRLATYVNVLPATADNYFCNPGGLFRLGLEVGFYALQGTDGHIVSGRATISTRRQLEPRWRLATFFAGLCSELHRTLSHLVITDERGNVWPAYLVPLTLWLSQGKSSRFFIRWLPKAVETRALGLFALPHVVSAESMQHLSNGNSVVVPQLLACVAGTPVYREQNILVDLVKRSAAMVIDRNLIVNANRHGRPILGAHIERYLIDAMRRLVASHPAWLPNQERSRIWYGRDGLFVVWPNAANEIRKLLEEEELPGIPQSPQTILEILIDAKAVIPRDKSVVWSISPPLGNNVVHAIKLAAPEILLAGGAEHQPLSESLATNPVDEPGAKPTTSVVQESSTQQQNLFVEPRSTESPRGPNVVITPDGEIIEVAAEGSAPKPNADTVESKPMPGPAFHLNAPMRLHPQVRLALAQAVESMNGDPKHATALTVSTGVFIPIHHFKNANVELPVAMRALGELDMAVSDKAGRPRTLKHELAGQTVAGVVLRPQFVQGLDPTCFAREPLEVRHADSSL